MDKAILSFHFPESAEAGRTPWLRALEKWNSLRSRERGAQVVGPVLSREHTHTRAGGSSFASTEPPFFSRKSDSFTALGGKEMESPAASGAPLPSRGLSASPGQGRSLPLQGGYCRGSPPVCAAWCRARAGLSRSFSEKQLSSDSVGSTFLHDEGGIPVFTLNNVFLCLNRTHDVLNSSRFLAPYCSSSGTGTGLRPLAEARTQGWSGHLLRLEFPLGGWKSGSAPGRGLWSGCSSTLG